MRYLESIVGVLTIIIGVFQIIPNYFTKTKEELDNLRILFKSTQTISERLQTKIEKYIIDHKNPNELIFDNISFENYLILLKQSYSENLNNEIYSNFKVNNYTKSNIKSMTKSIEAQINALLEIENRIKLLEINKKEN